MRARFLRPNSDVLRPGSSIVTWNKSAFAPSLRPILRSKKIELRTHPGIAHGRDPDGDRRWFRDHYVPTGSRYLVGRKMSDDAWERYRAAVRVRPEPSYFDPRNEKLQGGSLLVMPENWATAKSALGPRREADVLIEGGNVIALEEGSVLIGKDTRLVTAAVRRERGVQNAARVRSLSMRASKKHAVYEAALNRNVEAVKRGEYKEAGEAILKTLGLTKDSVIWLEQPAYHLDLGIAAGPGKTVFVHDPRLVAALPLDRELRDSARREARELGPVIDAVIEKLEKKGLTPIRVPGRLSDAKGNVIACFMNSLVGRDERAQFFYITGASGLALLEEAFAQVLKNSGVRDVHFIGDPADVRANLALAGSLRCQTVSGLTPPLDR